MTAAPRNIAKVTAKNQWNVRIRFPPEDARIIAQALGLDGLIPSKF
jgi:hypothetical protein